MPIKYFCDWVNNGHGGYIKHSGGIIRVRQILSVKQEQRKDLLNKVINVKNSAYGDRSPVEDQFNGEVGKVCSDSLCPLLAQTLLYHKAHDRCTEWKKVISAGLFLHDL